MEAVKLVKEEFSLSLKDAMTLVEAMENDRAAGATVFQQGKFPDRFGQGHSPGKVLTMVPKIFMAVAVLLLAIAATVAYDTDESLAASEQVPGRVVDLVYASGGGYKPLVEYELEGKTLRREGGVASTPPSYEIGEEVVVYVSKENGWDVRIGGFLELWFLPMVLGFIGAVFLFIGGVAHAVMR